MDSIYEGPETFSLSATIAGGPAAGDTATIVDDGSGVVYDDDGNPTAAKPDDDRPVPPPQKQPQTPPVLAVPSSTVQLPNPDVRFGYLEIPPVSKPQAEPIKELPALTLANQVPEQYANKGATSSFALPADAFAHTDATEVLRLSASLADGQRLPNWIQFDANTGTFKFQAPPDFVGELKIKVNARDSKGNEASTIFRFNIGKKKEGATPAGRASLSEQLRQASGEARFAQYRVDARIAKGAALSKAAT